MNGETIEVGAVNGAGMMMFLDDIPTKNFMEWTASEIISQVMQFERYDDTSVSEGKGIITHDRIYNRLVERYAAGSNTSIIKNRIFTGVRVVQKYMDSLIASDLYPYTYAHETKYGKREIYMFPLCLRAALDCEFLSFQDWFRRSIETTLEKFMKKFEIDTVFRLECVSEENQDSSRSTSGIPEEDTERDIIETAMIALSQKMNIHLMPYTENSGRGIEVELKEKITVGEFIQLWCESNPPFKIII